MRHVMWQEIFMFKSEELQADHFNVIFYEISGERHICEKALECGKPLVFAIHP